MVVDDDDNDLSGFLLGLLPHAPPWRVTTDGIAPAGNPVHSSISSFLWHAGEHRFNSTHPETRGAGKERVRGFGLE